MTPSEDPIASGLPNWVWGLSREVVYPAYPAGSPVLVRGG